MLARVLNAVLLGLILTFPVSYYVFDRETLEVEELREGVPTSRLMTLGDGLTHYQVVGGDWSPRIVLIHGATVPMDIWMDYMVPLESAGFQVLRYDLYGRGLSDRIDGDYDRELHVRQLAELLAALAGDDQPVDLMGNSMGAAVAAAFAARYPDRVRNLVLIAPVVDYSDNIPAVARMPILGEYFIRVFGVPRAIGRVSAMAQRLPAGQELIRRYTTQAETEGFEDLLLSLARGDALGDYRDTYQRVGQLGIPTMLFWGREDREIPREHVMAIRERIPGLRIHGIDGAGHELGVSHHALLFDLMLPWLKRNW